MQLDYDIVIATPIAHRRNDTFDITHGPQLHEDYKTKSEQRKLSNTFI